MKCFCGVNNSKKAKTTHVKVVYMADKCLLQMLNIGQVYLWLNGQKPHFSCTIRASLADHMVFSHQKKKTRGSSNMIYTENI